MLANRTLELGHPFHAPMNIDAVETMDPVRCRGRHGGNLFHRGVLQQSLLLV
jgi:hypothetical protein